MKSPSVNINGIKIDITDYSILLQQINSAIDQNRKLCIAYANANSVNFSYNNPEFKNYLQKFDIIHPDGIGIKLAINFLRPGLYKGSRFTGSDFYPLLTADAIKHNRKVFFFGNTDEVLSKISGYNHGLQITGLQNGYNFEDEKVIARINASKADVLIVGLGTPLQEKWIAKHSDNISCRVVICVGDGISVIAGTRQRGPVLMRAIGMEWFHRLLSSPLKYFKRYIIGNPLFLYRIIILKMRKLAE
jgi:N-acetylglucosaminyldiphosphoundecaprenol N-acetyl-beta-D-mannosaminyltransferase